MKTGGGAFPRGSIGCSVLLLFLSFVLREEDLWAEDLEWRWGMEVESNEGYVGSQNWIGGRGGWSSSSNAAEGGGEGSGGIIGMLVGTRGVGEKKEGSGEGGGGQGVISTSTSIFTSVSISDSGGDIDPEMPSS